MKRSSTPITPRALVMGMVCAICVLWFLHVLNLREDAVNWGGPSAAARVLNTVAVYVLACVLCLRIATEYRQESWMRFAWIAMAMNAGVSAVRHICDTPVWDALFPGYRIGWLLPVLREVFAAIALLFLAAGIWTMAVALLRMRLGFSLKRQDLAAIVGVFAILLLVIYFRNDLSEAGPIHPAASRLQLFSQALFTVVGAGAIVLLRLGKQMGGGRLAEAMGWIIAHIVVRALLVLAAAIQVHVAAGSALALAEMLAYQCTPWMFAIAAACRYQLKFTASRQAARWGVNWNVLDDAA